MNGSALGWGIVLFIIGLLLVGSIIFAAFGVILLLIGFILILIGILSAGPKPNVVYVQPQPVYYPVPAPTYYPPAPPAPPYHQPPSPPVTVNVQQAAAAVPEPRIMRRCQHCGTVFPETSAKCPSCGAPF